MKDIRQSEVKLAVFSSRLTEMAVKNVKLGMKWGAGIFEGLGG